MTQSFDKGTVKRSARMAGLVVFGLLLAGQPTNDVLEWGRHWITGLPQIGLSWATASLIGSLWLFLTKDDASWTAIFDDVPLP